MTQQTVQTIGIVVRGMTVGGAGRFLTELLQELDTRYIDVHVIAFCDTRVFEKKYSNITWVYVPPIHIALWDYIRVLWHIRRYRLDWMIYPKHIIPLTHIIFRRLKKIVIIHDLAYFHTQVEIARTTTLVESFYMKISIRVSVYLADMVATVSEFTKQEVVRVLSVPREQIVVISEGVSDVFRSRPDVDVTHIYDIHSPFLFYPGSLIPRKNISRVVAAFASIADDIPHHLYITGIKHTGSLSFGAQAILSQIQALGMKDRIHILGYIPDDHVCALYQQATACIYPSLYEGFGLPIIEAQAAGCPVITSRSSACKEVAGTAAWVVDPYVIEDIASAVHELCTNTETSSHLRTKGYLQSKTYSWAKTVDAVLVAMNI
jgi:glycosyltransferase involved in cell wall biosynthesis